MIGPWVKARCPHLELDYQNDDSGVRKPNYSALGTVCDDVLVAGVVYEGYNKRNVDMHIASDGNWCWPPFFGEAFRYPFFRLGVARVTGKTPASNGVSRRFQESLGFRLEGVIRSALPDGDDLAIYGMLLDECKWVGVGKSGFDVFIR